MSSRNEIAPLKFNLPIKFCVQEPALFVLIFCTLTCYSYHITQANQNHAYQMKHILIDSIYCIHYVLLLK